MVNLVRGAARAYLVWRLPDLHALGLSPALETVKA